jgi:phosphatidylglycerol---prolipoprotein diacylglyceryl transferase
MHPAASPQLLVLAVGLPYVHLGAIGPIQSFGMIVVAGILVGAALLRRYAEWHGVKDEHIRGFLTTVIITGFVGAHLFDVVAYEWHRVGADPLLVFKFWDGISSFGGFIGATIGFVVYARHHRLPGLMMCDTSIVGLLPAFTIGRIACTMVSDHIGAAADPTKWYAALAMNYPTNLDNDPIRALVARHPGTGATILAWNLGLVEFLYLVPINVVMLWLAFRASRRLPAALMAAMTGLLYAPVRFFLEYLRPELSDPRYLGFTFAQWGSIVAFAAALYAIARILSHGKAAATVTATPREAHELALAQPSRDDAAKSAAKPRGRKPKRPRKRR